MYNSVLRHGPKLVGYGLETMLRLGVHKCLVYMLMNYVLRCGVYLNCGVWFKGCVETLCKCLVYMHMNLWMLYSVLRCGLYLNCLIDLVQVPRMHAHVMHVHTINACCTWYGIEV